MTQPNQNSRRFIFDPTLSLGNIITSLTIVGSVMMTWSSLQSTLAIHSTEIKQLQSVAARYDTERSQDRADIKELIKEVKSEVKDVKATVDYIRNKGQP